MGGHSTGTSIGPALEYTSPALRGRGGVAEWLNAAVSKTVMGGLRPSRVRIPPPPLTEPESLSGGVGGSTVPWDHDVVSYRQAFRRRHLRSRSDRAGVPRDHVGPQS